MTQIALTECPYFRNEHGGICTAPVKDHDGNWTREPYGACFVSDIQVCSLTGRVGNVATRISCYEEFLRYSPNVEAAVRE